MSERIAKAFPVWAGLTVLVLGLLFVLTGALAHPPILIVSIIGAATSALGVCVARRLPWAVKTLAVLVAPGMTWRRFAIAAVAGSMLTAATMIAGAFLSARGNSTLAAVLNWPNTLLQAAVPCRSLSVGERTVCEGTPLNVAAFALSVPIGWLAYSIAAYAMINSKWIRRRPLTHVGADREG